jgi:membrane fusion protein (multidrug efflux system)
MPVRMMLGADGGAPVEGAVFAIDPSIDPTTRNVRLRATVPQGDTRLRPGMFVDVAVVQPSKADVVAVPQTAVVRAPYGDSVFVVEGDPPIVRQQFVKLGASRGDFVAIASGLKAGEQIVVGGAFKLRNKSRVTITKEAEPHPELAPRPPNR